MRAYLDELARIYPHGVGEGAPHRAVTSLPAQVARFRGLQEGWVELEVALAVPEGLRAGAASGDQTLDQVILEYLTHEAEQEQLVLMLEESRNVGLGQHAALELHAKSSKSGQGISGANVSVKMISTASEPKVLAKGEADPGGVVRLDFDIPHLARGTSALIITASSAIGRAELKQLL